MRCPTDFCPSSENDSLNVHHTEWTSSYYCTTCGYEKLVEHETAQVVKFYNTSVARPKSNGTGKNA